MKNFHKDSSVARFRWSSDESDQDYLERNRVIGQCEDELSRITLFIVIIEKLMPTTATITYAHRKDYWNCYCECTQP
jgi:hypothetical protein